MHTNPTDALTERILAAVFEVSNTLGAGFLEKVYERALLHELKLHALQASPQNAFPVIYKGHSVGEYCPDILVENTVLVELKCVDHLGKEHMAQCLNYLRVTRKPVCLLINFYRPKVEWKRIAGTPDPP